MYQMIIIFNYSISLHIKNIIRTCINELEGIISIKQSLTKIIFKLLLEYTTCSSNWNTMFILTQASFCCVLTSLSVILWPNNIITLYCT